MYPSEKDRPLITMIGRTEKSSENQGHIPLTNVHENSCIKPIKLLFLG